MAVTPKHPLVAKLRRAVRRLIEAEVSYAWRGAGHPEDILPTELELKQAKVHFRACLEAINKELMP